VVSLIEKGSSVRDVLSGDAENVLPMAQVLPTAMCQAHRSERDIGGKCMRVADS